MGRTVIVSAYPFTAADGTNVSALNSSNDWVEQNASNGQLRIVSNGYQNAFGNMADNSWKGAGSFTTDQYFSVKLVGTFGGNDKVGGSVLNNGGAFGSFSAYRVYYFDSTGTAGIVVEKIVNGTVTAVGTQLNVTLATGDTLECEATTSGGVVTFTLYKNGISQGTRSDSSSILTTGKPGICGLISGAQIRGDDWEAGNVTTGGATNTKVMSETLTLADTNVSGAQRPRVQSETVTLADSTIPYRRLVRVPQEALILADSTVQMRRLRRVIDEAITLADAFSKTVVLGGQVITTKVMSEALTLNDGFVDWLRRVRLQTDTVLITEDNTTRTFIITGEEALTLADELIKWRRLKRLMDEQATLADSFSKTVISSGATLYTKVLTETIVLFDEALDRATYRRVAEDTQVLSDSKVQYSSAGVFGPPAIIAKVVRYVGVLP